MRIWWSSLLKMFCAAAICQIITSSGFVTYELRVASYKLQVENLSLNLRVMSYIMRVAVSFTS